MNTRSPSVPRSVERVQSRRGYWIAGSHFRGAAYVGGRVGGSRVRRGRGAGERLPPFSVRIRVSVLTFHFTPSLLRPVSHPPTQSVPVPRPRRPVPDTTWGPDGRSRSRGTRRAWL